MCRAAQRFCCSYKVLVSIAEAEYSGTAQPQGQSGSSIFTDGHFHRLNGSQKRILSRSIETINSICFFVIGAISWLIISAKEKNQKNAKDRGAGAFLEKKNAWRA